MPAKSKAQARFMYAVQNNPKLAKEKGISPEVAHEFTEGLTKDKFKGLKERLKKKK